MNNHKYQAVLFDLDGVLIDSMSAHANAWQTVFAEFGVDLPRMEILLREGEKAELSMDELCEKYGVELTAPEKTAMLAKKRQIYSENAPKSMYTGAGDVLQRIHDEGYRMALVTGSVAKNLERIMTAEQLALFEVIITGKDVKNAKPDPEPYLTALKKLGLQPEVCLVVENAPLGIQAAKAAGLKVAAITTTLGREVLTEAGWIIGNLKEIGSILSFGDQD
ncbi:MAG: HAD family phosphatase [FCB group bacterium]|nr:HAD family phosphatase [FCB group bacterium]